MTLTPAQRALALRRLRKLLKKRRGRRQGTGTGSENHTSSYSYTQEKEPSQLEAEIIAAGLQVLPKDE